MSKATETQQKTRKGRVVSTDMDKTLVVEVEQIQQHDLYKKYLRRHSRFKVHDENEEASVGDLVLIEETRPISKTKRWRLMEILQASGEQAVEIEESEMGQSEVPDEVEDEGDEESAERNEELSQNIDDQEDVEEDEQAEEGDEDQ